MDHQVTQLRLIDDVEVGRPASRAYPLSIRVAFEAADATATTTARLDAPGGLQITAYQELG